MGRVSRSGRAPFSKGGNPVSIQLTTFRGASIVKWGGTQTETTARNRHATLPFELGDFVTETTARRSEGRITRRGRRRWRRGRRAVALLESSYALLQVVWWWFYRGPKKRLQEGDIGICRKDKK